MAVMDATNRFRCFAHLARSFAWPGIVKGDLSAAVNATDQWIDDNATAYNNSLPPAFRNNTNAAQKTILFCMVALRRAGLLKTQED